MPEYEYRIVPMQGNFSYYVLVMERMYPNMFQNQPKLIYRGDGEFCRTIDEVAEFIREWEYSHGRNNI